MNPISIEGDTIEWKNIQKNEKKNKTSDKMKNSIPNFNPWVTIGV